MDIKKNWSVWLAVALPLAMILFVAGSIYLPRLWAPKPMYNFVYAANDMSKGYVIPSYAVRVVNGHLVKEKTSKDGLVPDAMKAQYVEPRLYRYDVTTGESNGITFDEAAQLKLDDSNQSPDGFKVSLNGGYSGPFGGGPMAPAVYMTGHLVSQKLDLRGVSNAYDFEFVGWIAE